MHYLGSKSSIAQDILNIVLSGFGSTYMTYVEPFVGSCSVIKHVQVYDGTRVIGFDKNHYLIALLNYGKVSLNCEDPATCGFGHRHYDQSDFIGKDVSQEEYLHIRQVAKLPAEERMAAGYTDEYIGYVGFFFSIQDDFFSGYRATSTRSIASLKSFIRTVDMLHKKELYALDYQRLTEILPAEPIIIYADPPHVGTKFTGHSFIHNWLNIKRQDFEAHAMEWAKTHKVFISDYIMNPQFKEVWAARDYLELHGEELNIKRAAKRTAKIEKLFTI